MLGEWLSVWAIYRVGLVVLQCLFTWAGPDYGGLLGGTVLVGSRMGDFCTWMWCSPCALCQETRTLWANNVHEGVWHGRPQQQPPLLLPATSPPPAQAVTGTPVVPKTV